MQIRNICLFLSSFLLFEAERCYTSDENKVIRIAKCDVFSGACESIWYLRAFRCESLYAVYTETAASCLSACRAAVGLYSCTVAWLHVRNCQHRTDYSVVTLCLQIQNCVAYINILLIKYCWLLINWQFWRKKANVHKKYIFTTVLYI